MDDNYRHPLNEKKMKFRSNVLGTKNGNTRWVVLITICAFLLSSSLSFVSSSLLEDVNIFFFNFDRTYYRFNRNCF